MLVKSTIIFFTQEEDSLGIKQKEYETLGKVCFDLENLIAIHEDVNAREEYNRDRTLCFLKSGISFSVDIVYAEMVKIWENYKAKTTHIKLN